MNIFKKKSLCVALAGVGALGAAGAAQAVNLNPDGLGEVLVYPYYTVRSDAHGNAYNSLLSIVNTTGSVKAVKVRFLEGKNSQEVLDFNLFLSKHDVWTAAIVPSGAGGAMVQTADNSCTLPALPAAGVPFRNSLYALDGGGSSLDRTNEGYVEIIEMTQYWDTSTTAANATHDSSGMPNCAKVTDSQANKDAINRSAGEQGGLMGGMTLINVDAGTDYTEDAVALANFATFDNLYTTPGSLLPDMTFADPPTSVVPDQGGTMQSTWAPVGTQTPDPVSAVLIHDNVMNEYVLDAITASGTDWVVTMPTKRFYVAKGTGRASKLFQRNFNSTAGSCDDVNLNIYDREEQTPGSSLDFSPPGPSGTAICWEANVITFNNSSVLGSVNSQNITTGYEHGWLDLSWFPTSSSNPDGLSPPVQPTHTLINSGVAPLVNTFTPIAGSASNVGPATYVGLPVVGFAVQSFTNGALTVNGASVLSNYGGNFIHKSTRLINFLLP